MKNKDNYTVSNGEYLVKKTKGLDLAAKIMSVLIAFVIWLYVIFVYGPISGSEDYELRVSGVSVDVINNASGLNGFIGSDRTVAVTVKGNQSDVISLTPDDIKASVDAAELAPGIYELEVKAELQGKNMEISDIFPKSVTVYISKQTSVQLPIVINTELINETLDADCVIEKQTPDVSYVTAEGPEDELSKISKAMVTLEPNSITSTRDAVGTVTLYDNDGNVFSSKYVSCSVSVVHVDLQIYKYKDVPLTVGYKYGYYNDSTVNVTVEPSSVRVKGPVSKVNALDSIKIATLDETAILNDGPISYSLFDLDIYEGVTAVDDINNVTVTVEHKNTAAKMFSVKNFRLENQESGSTYTFSVDSLNVMLRGTVGEYFSYFDDDDVTVVVDMKNYKGHKGDVTVPAAIEISNSSSDCVIYAIGSYYVPVRIS